MDSPCRPATQYPYFSRHPLLTWGLIGFGALLFAATTYSLLSHQLLFPYDQPVLAQFNAARQDLPGWEISLLNAFSILGSVGSPVIAVGFGIYWWWKQCKWRFFLLVFSFGGALILFFGLMFLFNRQRPSLPNLLSMLPLPSYPSGHTVMVLALYIPLLYLYLPEVRSWLWRAALVAVGVTLMLLMGLDRLLLGAHYLTDVLAGYGLGLSWSVLVIYWMEHTRRWKDAAADAVDPS